MSIPKPYTDKAIRSEIRHLIRLYPRDQVGEAIVRYIGDNFTPKLSPQKNDNLLYHPDVIIGLVCGHFHMSLEEMKVGSRKPYFSYPRHVMQYMLTTRSMLSLFAVGKMFAKHHTTVMAARNKIINLYEKSVTARADIDQLINLLPKRVAQKTEE